VAAGDDYRIKAADLNALAQRERDPLRRAELEALTLSYLRLADQADRNAQADLFYESPGQPLNAQQQQQQQQPQPKKESD
jgi:hypothetical protein